MKRTKETGITLIALIITIIVLLILAGVAINLTVGDNGIFQRAQESAKIYQNAANNEATTLNSVYDEISKLIEETTGGIYTEGIYTENNTINGEEPSAFNPEIPKGFKPVDVDTAIWGDGTTPPTEEAVKSGLVIEDSEGNQFVWIAVDGTTVALNRYEFDWENKTPSVYSGTNVEEDATDTDNLLNYGNTIAKDINAFISSVEEHGGYYIARYEASYGTDKKPNSKISTGTLSYFDYDSDFRPTEEGHLWINVTQPDAAAACRTMYGTNYGITSDLMNSYAWSTALVFIQAYSDDSVYSCKDANVFSYDLTDTGTNGDEKCHINDMASNCSEWITETANIDSTCVRVSESYYWDKEHWCASDRFSCYLDYYALDISFRPILYL